MSALPGAEVAPHAARAPAAVRRTGALALAGRALDAINRGLLGLSMLALLGAAGVLTASVLTRYFFKIPTDWQDEASVFLMVAATFLCGAYVQSYRGHVGIAALAGLLPPRVDRWRRVVADLISLLFCAFFSWKSWTLLHEAVAEGQTSSSSWAPPLWIPYSFMAVGMTLVALQLLVQLLRHFAPAEVVR